MEETKKISPEELDQVTGGAVIPGMAIPFASNPLEEAAEELTEDKARPVC